MRFDIHLHTVTYSGCGKMTPKELLTSAVAAGLDGVMVTDHFFSFKYRFWPEEDWNKFQQLAEAYDLTLLKGVEISCSEGFDFLIYGSLDFLPLPRKLACKRRLRPEKIVELGEEAGCFVALAHPYRKPDTDLPGYIYDLDLDGIEVKSNNMKTGIQQERALRLAREMGWTAIAGSDGHRMDVVGKWGVDFEGTITSEKEFVAELRAGRFSIFGPTEEE